MAINKVTQIEAALLSAVDAEVVLKKPPAIHWNEDVSVKFVSIPAMLLTAGTSSLQVGGMMGSSFGLSGGGYIKRILLSPSGMVKILVQVGATRFDPEAGHSHWVVIWPSCGAVADLDDEG